VRERERERERERKREWTKLSAFNRLCDVTRSAVGPVGVVYLLEILSPLSQATRQ
jgi:hypothetical protein